MNLIYLPEALEEFDDSAERYEKSQTGLGARFRKAVERAVGRVQGNPLTYPRYPRTACRQKTVYRFPFSVIYRPKAGTLLIVAIAHHKRRPGYWKSRLKKS